MIATVERALVEHFGLLPRTLWQRHIPAAVEAASAALGVEPAVLLEAMPHDARAAEEVAGYLMVGETHFLRHPEHFETALAHLASAAADDASRPLRVWSAGCSSGEEPYSLLLTLLERAPQLASRVEVLATDLDAAAIRAARAAVFGGWSFRQRELAWTRPFFTPAGPDRQALRPELVRRVRFEQEPIERTLGRLPAAHFDAIFFRNVGIYLDDAARARIFAGFARVVRDDGRLVVSPTDPRPGRELFTPDGAAPTCWFRPFRGAVPPPLAVRGGAPVSQLAAARPAKKGHGSPRPAGKAGGARRPPETTGPAPSSSPALVPAPPADGTWLEERARQLADRGQLRAAIALLDEAVDGSLAALRLRGALHLAGGAREAALVDFRSLLYHRPGDRAARFWIALVLHELGQAERARQHLRQLESRLAAQPADEPVEDGQTTVAELLAAVRQRLEEAA